MTKRLTRENWNQTDPLVAGMASLIDGEAIPMQPQHYADALLTPDLDLPDTVPPGVRDLYESARAVAVYSGFYYPLSVVGVDLLGRTLEAAASEALLAQGGRARTFKETIDELARRGVLTRERRDSWHALRRFRNASAHARDLDDRYPIGVTHMHFVNALTEIAALFPG